MVLNVGRYLEFPTVVCVGNVGHATLVTHNVSKIPIALTAEVRCDAIDNVPTSATDFSKPGSVPRVSDTHCWLSTDCK